MMKLVCSTAIVLFYAKDFNAAFHIGGAEIAELAETDAVNFAGASPSAVIESSERIFRRRVQEENTLLPATRS